MQLSSSFGKRSPTLWTLISTKTKCIKLIFIGKITLVPVAFLMALSIYLHVNLKQRNKICLNQNFDTSCLPKRLRQTVKKQSDQALPCQAICEFTFLLLSFYLRTEREKCSKF